MSDKSHEDIARSYMKGIMRIWTGDATLWQQAQRNGITKAEQTKLCKIAMRGAKQALAQYVNTAPSRIPQKKEL